MPTYVWKHKETGELREVFAPIKDIDKFLEEVPDPEAWCRLLIPPRVLRKTFLDGQRAQNDATYRDLRDCAELEVQHANSTNPEERKLIRQEIAAKKEL